MNSLLVILLGLTTAIASGPPVSDCSDCVRKSGQANVVVDIKNGWFGDVCVV